jgi:sensor histidine kinase YesM
MNKGVKYLLQEWLIHLLIAWVGINLFTLVPYIYHVKTWGNYKFNTDGSPVTAWQYFLKGNYYQHDFLVVVIFIFITEYNYQYLFKKFNLGVFAFFCLLAGILSFSVLAILHPDNFARLGKLSAVEPIFIMAGYALIYALIRDYFYQLRHKKDVQLQQYKSELSNLKAQLNPHFLFNSLNYLYGTALREKAPDTASGIEMMAEMMRYTITGIDENFVPLTRELEFINRYLSLQQGRLPQKGSVQIDVQISPVHENLIIAPLLLLPFIENAFKYGISIDHPCSINIKIDITADRLTMYITNSIINGHHEVKGNNTGIKNTIKRLKLLYPNNYMLETKSNKTNYAVMLAINLNKPIQ